MATTPNFTGNYTQSPAVQTWTPVFKGQTDDPVATYTTQVAWFYLIGKLCFFSLVCATSTLTKTTLTDLFSVSLPFAAATRASMVQQGSARVENGTAVANAVKFEIASAGTTMQFRNYTLAATSAQITWAATTPGVGVLTNAITVTATGFYEIA